MPDTLNTLMRTQHKRGIPLNAETMGRFPLLDWYKSIENDPLMASKKELLTTSKGLLYAFGSQINICKRYCFDSVGQVRLDYIYLLLASLAAHAMLRCPYDERVLLEALVRHQGAVSLNNMIKGLKPYCKNDIFYPDFRLIDGVYIGNGNRLTTMSVMAYFLKPAYKCAAFIVTTDDIVKQSFCLDLLGTTPKQYESLRAQGKLKFMPYILESLECKLMPYILRGDFGCVNTSIVDVINKYQAGELLKYREGLKGRKPITVYPFQERMYPSLNRVLNERLDKLLSFAAENNYSDTDLNVYYVTPYYFAFAISSSKRKELTRVLSDIYAKPVNNITEPAIFNGSLL